MLYIVQKDTTEYSTSSIGTKQSFLSTVSASACKLCRFDIPWRTIGRRSNGAIELIFWTSRRSRSIRFKEVVANFGSFALGRWFYTNDHSPIDRCTRSSSIYHNRIEDRRNASLLRDRTSWRDAKQAIMRLHYYAIKHTDVTCSLVFVNFSYSPSIYSRSFFFVFWPKPNPIVLWLNRLSDVVIAWYSFPPTFIRLERHNRRIRSIYSVVFRCFVLFLIPLVSFSIACWYSFRVIIR